MERHYHRLPNGLTLVGEHHPDARSIAAGFFVRTGARDETPEVAGVSHFLEHMMFKGTARRSPFDVNREFDEMGARYNAFTSEENTVYYGQVLPRFQGRLLDLLGDMMRPAIRDEDFTMEKNVILEEIAMYQDKPSFVVFDRAREAYYGAHPLGHSVLGSRQSIAELEAEQMRAYFGRRYAADNITLVLTGNYDWDAVQTDAERLCGAWEPSGAGRELPPYAGQTSLRVERPRDDKGADKFNRAHVAFLCPGYSAQSPERYAALLAGEVLGGGESSRLYWALVHPGLAEAASISHDSSDGTGAFYGYLLADPTQVSEAYRTFRSVLAKACADGLTVAEIERAKKRLASATVLRAETPMGRLTAVGYDWIYRQETKSADEALDALLAVTPDEVNALLAAQPFERATTVALGPLDEL